MSDDRLQRGRDYVVELRTQGHSDDEIRQGLAESGWRQRDIERLLFGTAPAPPPPAPAAATPAAAGTQATDVAGARAENRPAELTLGVMLTGALAVSGLLATGASWLTAAGHGISPASYYGLTSRFLVFGPFIYLGLLVVGYFLWHGYTWARNAMIALLGVYILFALLGVPGRHLFTRLTSFQVLFSGIMIWALTTRTVRDYCSR